MSSSDDADNDDTLSEENYITVEISSNCTENSELDCCICMDAQATHIITNCGHTVVCDVCYLKIDKCPICRTEITDSNQPADDVIQQNSRCCSQKIKKICSAISLWFLMNLWCWTVLIFLGGFPITESIVIVVFVTLCTLIMTIKVYFICDDDDDEDIVDADNV